MIFPWQWPVMYKNVFDTNDGRLVLADLMKRFKVFSNTYRANDTHGTAFCEGQRSVVLDLLRHINVSDSDILTMKDEYERATAAERRDTDY